MPTPKLTADDLIAQAAERGQAKKDPTLHNFEAPLGYHLKGVSTLIDKDGKVTQTWVKTQKSMEDPQAILDLFQIAVAQREIVVAPKVKQAKYHDKDLLTVYPMGDPHLGMLSWKEETGEDFDIKLAEENLITAVDRLVDLAPASEKALIINVGDFFHSDNMDNRTSRSDNALDVDTRWAKILRIGIVTMTRCIDRALEKHKTVRVINEIGNHDDHSSVMLSLCLSHHYRLNPRVEIDTSPAKFHWYHFGKCLIGVTHGDTVKLDQLPGIMAHDQAEAWGVTKHRHWFTGHFHNQTMKEFAGCRVEILRTLAARDFWHDSKGYRSGRSMNCVVFSAEHGLILRHEIGIEEVRQRVVNA
jgi:hypothetical protein